MRPPTMTFLVSGSPLVPASGWQSALFVLPPVLGGLLFLGWLAARAAGTPRARAAASALRIAWVGTALPWAVHLGWSHALGKVHPAHALAMEAPFVAGIAATLAVAAWLVLFGRPEGEDGCGGCAHTLVRGQDACPECGWRRGSARFVREARLRALAGGGVAASLAAGATMLVLAWTPLAWSFDFLATVRATHPSGHGAEILEVAGVASQRMTLVARSAPFEPAATGSLALRRPNARASFASVDPPPDATPGSVDAFARAAVERGAESPAGSASSMLITMRGDDAFSGTRPEAEAGDGLDADAFLVESSMAFLRGLLGDRDPSWPAPLESVRVTSMSLRPRWTPLVLPTVAALVAFAVVAKRGWRRASTASPA